MMRVEMTKDKFDAYDDTSLIWACVEPVIQMIRGKSLDVKKSASSELNESQRALLMFQVILGHSNGGIESLFAQISYMLSDRGVWNEFIKSARLFKDGRLYAIYGKLEEAYFSNTGEPPERLEAELSAALPESVRLAAAYIRGNPDQFVMFAD